jgi:hypothetical protein
VATKSPLFANGPTAFAVSFLITPASFGFLVVARIPKWQLAAFILVAVLLPLAIGGSWVYRSRTTADAMLRGILTGGFAGVVFLVATYVSVRLLGDGRMPFLLMESLTVLVAVGGPALGAACTGAALAVAALQRS